MLYIFLKSAMFKKNAKWTEGYYLKITVNKYT